MPGPVSDSYDPEFGTSARANEFRENLDRLHAAVGDIIGAPPVDYLTLPERERGPAITARLHERDWRFIRYALERAAESI